MMMMMMLCSVFIILVLTFCGFAKAGHFSTTVHSENRISIIRKNCQSKHCTPAFAKPLLQAGVLSSVLLSPCLSWVSLSLSCWLCLGNFKNFRKEGILKNNFSVGKSESSFAIFGLCVGLCELQMCLRCVLAFLYVDSCPLFSSQHI